MPLGIHDHVQHDPMQCHLGTAPPRHLADRVQTQRVDGRVSVRPGPAVPPVALLADLLEIDGEIRFGYPVTVSDFVDTGPAPAPGNADPTPLNITSVTVYRPGWRYTCVGDWPEPVVPSPNSHR